METGYHNYSWLKSRIQPGCNDIFTQANVDLLRVAMHAATQTMRFLNPGDNGIPLNRRIDSLAVWVQVQADIEAGIYEGVD